MWATITKYRDHGTITCLLGSGRPFKLTSEMLKAIEETMQQDDETTVTQLTKMLEERRWNISWSTVERARKTLGWTFHRSRYSQLIRNVNKKKTVGKR